MKKIYPLIFVPTLLVVTGYLYVSFLLSFSMPSLPSSAVILDTNGDEIGEIVYSGSIRHREMTFEEIPEFYRTTLVHLEDRSFYTNNGIDLRWIIRSIVHNLVAGKTVEWASTLSAQLVRNALWLEEDRTFLKKIRESLASVRLNNIYSKQEILTLYANRISFGYMNYGLRSAAKYYFDKEPKNLTASEQLTLIAIPKNPKRYDPYSHPKLFDERFHMLVSALKKDGIVSDPEAKSMLSEKLAFNTHHANELPYVVDFMKNNYPALQAPLLNRRGAETRAGVVSTTFDLNLTKKIEQIANGAVDELTWRNVSDYGILIAERGLGEDPETSSGWRILDSGWQWSSPKLRVMIGGVNYHESTAWQVNSTLALRQPGSTIKPFTYALAFKNLGLTPSDTTLDLPVQYKTAENYSYEPKNYAGGYRGEVTLAEALSQSINIPAIKLTERIWVKTLLDFLRSIGITSLNEDFEHYGLALTLGDGEVSLYELLQAYTIFANGGKFCPFRVLNTQPPIPCIASIDEKYTEMIHSILTDRYVKLHGFPINSSLDFQDRNVFVKTGTSRNFRDNWAIGFTSRYMIGVWTGNKNAENMKGVSGATGAWEIFSRVVYALEPNESEQKPKSLEMKKSPYLEITNPLSGSLYRIDLSKPASLQTIKIWFASNITAETHNWLLDGKPLHSGSIVPTLWNHTIELFLIKDGVIISRKKSAFDVESTQ